MPAPVLITPPVWDPITLAEAKAHLRIDDSDSDALVAGLIAAAVAYFDGWTGILGRALEPQTWEMRFDRFPAWIRIPLGPVVSVTSIKYDDRDGAEQTVDPGLYQLDAAPVEACVVLAPGASWPTTADTVNAVRVRWVAGTGCPEPVRHALLLLIGHWYEHREAVGAAADELPLGVRALITPWRRVGL